MCVGRPYSLQSLTCVSSWRFVRLPPSRNSNYLGYRYCLWCARACVTSHAVLLYISSQHVPASLRWGGISLAVKLQIIRVSGRRQGKESR
ncbi:hypothetical protein CTV95_08810 [Pectobacterium brasiliense]|nr:hypothetical protein CTV95_08810 [Pectobacterium brasiliense]